MPIYTTSLFIFRRDLRLQDNQGLQQALAQSQQVIPCFIFDPRQIQAHPFQSQPALQYMLQSLADLQQQLHEFNAELALFQGLPEQIILKLSKQYAIEAVFMNRDYTPFSQQRDAVIATICQQHQIALHIYNDSLLNPPETCLKADGTPYKVFTAFYNNAKRIPIVFPQTLKIASFLKVASEITLDKIPIQLPEQYQPVIHGGRNNALNLFNELENCVDYVTDRDFPALNATSHLSAALKFGVCSIREAYYAIVTTLGESHPLLRQLYWRDFFSHLGYYFPKVFEKAFIDKCNALVWDNNLAYFQAWTEGKTGFPIVDAGMRELNATGLMHNRVRMIVASFLVKDLHLNWQWGERYFAQHLIDYDPCVNNGNWQWAASTGCDSQPYFRIFNPWLQQEKFDRDCVYIYRWLPELKKFSPAIIHQWHKKHLAGDYPAPLVEHGLQSQIIKLRFKAALA